MTRDDRSNDGSAGDEASSEEPPRETVSIPNEVDLPRLLDFYDLQDAEHTGIHEFYDNLRDGDFTTTRCDACGAVHFPPRIVCPECLSDDLSYTSLPHEGTLHSFTEVRGTAAIGMTDDTPFVAGVVDLGDVRLSARIDDASYEDLEIGDPVRLKIVDIDGPTDQDRVFYRFVPA
ncbi:Zn-ribbon domain-containing OB-fold protein [Halopenitus persicus]|uniref:Zn-ribbon domain-containing OB-fold protein n=1 Tax=Halopenitus persicus TaxID=1048396 RepID=UPI000BBACB57|nr:Zn-ribbon domain-containing OB-fold protein [Halopenitus persicus]